MSHEMCLLQGHEEYDDEITLAASGSATPPDYPLGQVCC